MPHPITMHDTHFKSVELPAISGTDSTPRLDFYSNSELRNDYLHVD
jgi:hypothetical protein